MSASNCSNVSYHYARSDNLLATAVPPSEYFDDSCILIEPLFNVLVILLVIISLSLALVALLETVNAQEPTHKRYFIVVVISMLDMICFLAVCKLAPTYVFIAWAVFVVVQMIWGAMFGALLNQALVESLKKMKGTLSIAAATGDLCWYVLLSLFVVHIITSIVLFVCAIGAAVSEVGSFNLTLFWRVHMASVGVNHFGACAFGCTLDVLVCNKVSAVGKQVPEVARKSGLIVSRLVLFFRFKLVAAFVFLFLFFGCAFVLPFYYFFLFFYMLMIQGVVGFTIFVFTSPCHRIHMAKLACGKWFRRCLTCSGESHQGNNLQNDDEMVNGTVDTGETIDFIVLSFLEVATDRVPKHI